jgi:Mlc titration factor MtfA (ptsG expression regulator)
MAWSLLFVAVLVLSVAGWLAGPPAWAAWRRSRLTATPFPSAWRALLRRRMPLYRRLPALQQRQLQRHVQVLLGQVPFIGCQGQVITDEVRVLVAAQAALLLLGRPAGSFRGLRQVLVYPGAFVVDRPVTDGGIVQDARRVLVGESWQQGQLILSWADVLAGAADPDDGHNVVIHEFAHQLDQERGRANGAPWLGRREAEPPPRRRGAAPSRPGRGAGHEPGDPYPRWARVLGAEFEQLRQRLARGETGVIAAYAATDPAEFFAVVSEHFFEQPAALAAAHPALYAEFARLYRCDPLAW